MTYVWIRRGYGPFVRCKNEVKALRRAKHWHRTGQGGYSGEQEKVIGLFVNSINSVQANNGAVRRELYS